MKLPLAILLLVLVAIPAGAQTLAAPIQGAYNEVYVITGRAIDSQGLPVSGGILKVELEQEGVRAEPLRAAANCKGDFITSFNLQKVDPAGRVKVTLLGPQGEENAFTYAKLDPFYRRSDVTLAMNEAWNNVCSRETDVWAVSASVSVRLLNRTEPYAANGNEFHAVPYTGILRLRYEAPDGSTICPPHPQDQTPGACETFLVDERGDMRYTFTLDRAFPAGGRVEILLQEGGTLDVPIDARTRIGVRHFEVTGQGAPASLYETPGLALVALVAIVGAVALARRR